MQIFPAINLER